MNRIFALAREIIHDHENGCFQKCLLDHEDFVSGKSFVSFYYLVILSTENLRLLW